MCDTILRTTLKSLLMASCNCNSGGGATLLMARCNGNSRGDAMLSMGTCYDGKGSGRGGAALLMGVPLHAVDGVLQRQWWARYCPVYGALQWQWQGRCRPVNQCMLQWRRQWQWGCRAVKSMSACCKGKGHVGGGTALSMAHCNGNGGGCPALLMVLCNCNSRGDTALSIGAYVCVC
jgi:hypothetical protein